MPVRAYHIVHLQIKLLFKIIALIWDRKGNFMQNGFRYLEMWIETDGNLQMKDFLKVKGIF